MSPLELAELLLTTEEKYRSNSCQECGKHLQTRRQIAIDLIPGGTELEARFWSNLVHIFGDYQGSLDWARGVFQGLATKQKNDSLMVKAKKCFDLFESFPG